LDLGFEGDEFFLGQEGLEKGVISGAVLVAGDRVGESKVSLGIFVFLILEDERTLGALAADVVSLRSLLNFYDCFIVFFLFVGECAKVLQSSHIFN
jgi:hypothetical protein